MFLLLLLILLLLYYWIGGRSHFNPKQGDQSNDQQKPLTKQFPTTKTKHFSAEKKTLVPFRNMSKKFVLLVSCFLVWYIHDKDKEGREVKVRDKNVVHTS